MLKTAINYRCTSQPTPKWNVKTATKMDIWTDRKFVSVIFSTRWRLCSKDSCIERFMAREIVTFGSSNVRIWGAKALWGFVWNIHVSEIVQNQSKSKQRSISLDIICISLTLTNHRVSTSFSDCPTNMPEYCWFTLRNYQLLIWLQWAELRCTHAKILWYCVLRKLASFVLDR